MDLIAIKNITVSDYQRETLPWTVQEIVDSIKDHGFNPAYPVVIDDDNTLVDGGHRIEAAKICGLTEVPFIRKPADSPNIRYALQCNADRAKGREDDVFDLAELCWKLAESGWTGDRIAACCLLGHLQPLAQALLAGARQPGKFCIIVLPDEGQQIPLSAAMKESSAE